MPRKTKTKLSKAKPAPFAPPASPPPASPSPASFDLPPPRPDPTLDDLLDVQAPSPEPEPEPELEPEDLRLIETELPEPVSVPVQSISKPEKQPRSPFFERLTPPPSQTYSRHRRPISLPNPRLSPPPEVDSRLAITPYGNTPHVVACVSCDSICLITNKSDYNRSKLGLHPSNRDTFIPIVCSACEDDRALFWCRMASSNSPPSRQRQYQGTISASMLQAWFIYRDMNARFGVWFDEREDKYKRVTRGRDWWREGVLSDGDLVRLYFWAPDRGRDGRGEEMKIVDMRRDLFFGQFVHPTEPV